ncbi:hypothetical protein SSP35_16_00280 [Streptomyces sp. NBRC 110611]|uniref:hypothetical protein n=1 Tax=Streptomyces sp. NBRC 110611 TaxID=1621259 RepID=UPI0008329B0B|nr:hypothetical protein [Streptomyces sp. NBRC 110611]GAU70033.1 hypothetical protein SSP35_16_00280 [Streptomyces sp. NBRC 110611]
MRSNHSDSGALGERDYPIEEKDLTEEQNEHLTKSLRAVRDNSNAPDALKELARKMLSGRLQLKDALDDPDGNRALVAGLAPLRDQWRSMSPQERQAVRERDPDEDARRGDLDPRRAPRR